MFNSKRFKEAATGWEVLSSGQLSWKGSFYETFKDYNFYKGSTSIPTIYDVRNIIDEITLKKGAKSESIIEEYFSDLDADSFKKISDIEEFIRKMIIFVDDYISKGKLDTELSNLLGFIGYLNKTLSSKANKKQGFEIGSPGFNPTDKAGPTNFFSMGFVAIKLLLEYGFKINPGLELFLIQNKDIDLLGTNDTNDRQRVVNTVLENKPYLEWFKDPENIVYWVRNIESLSDDESDTSSGPTKSQVLEVAKETFRSTPGYDLAVQLLYLLILHNPNLESSFISSRDINLLIVVLQRLFATVNEETPNINKLIEHIANNVSENSLLANAYILKNISWFMDFINNNFYLDQNRYILSGFSTKEKVLQYLKDNPEQGGLLWERGILTDFEPEMVKQIIKESTEAHDKIRKDAYEFIKLAEKKGIIKIYNAVDEFYNLGHAVDYEKKEYDEEGNLITQIDKEYAYTSYLDRFLEESPFSGIDPDDIKNYAKKMKIFEYDENSLKVFANIQNIKKVIIGHVNLFDESWSGLFIPRLKTIDGTIPAIIIKTNAYDTLEYHQQLSKNIKMDADLYTESTRRHEIAHALQYLAVGDEMMYASEVLNPEVTKEEAYLINPTEMYARVHGDIPYLAKIFEAHIDKMKADPIVYEAAKEQWITEMEDSIVHLSMGGTNTARLLEDLENERGHFRPRIDAKGNIIRLPDPTAAMNKTLKRQRIKLESMFYDLFNVQGRRDFRLKLLKRRSKLIASIEQQPEWSNYRFLLEEELKKVNQLIIESGKFLIFDVQGISESVVEGYLTDYFGKVSRAVSEGLLKSDVINPEGIDQLKEKIEKVGETADPPTSKDVREIARYQINMTKPIPAGREIDVIIPKFKGEGRPKGFYPQDEGVEEPESVGMEISDEDVDDDITDPFAESKRAGFNFRRYISG